MLFVYITVMFSLYNKLMYYKSLSCNDTQGWSQAINKNKFIKLIFAGYVNDLCNTFPEVILRTAYQTITKPKKVYLI